MMADVFFWFVYIGGVFAEPKKKRGFFSRLGWPINLGQMVYFWAKENIETAEQAKGE